jgi:hypothetical protein
MQEMTDGMDGSVPGTRPRCAESGQSPVGNAAAVPDMHAPPLYAGEVIQPVLERIDASPHRLDVQLDPRSTETSAVRFGALIDGTVPLRLQLFPPPQEFPAF